MGSDVSVVLHADAAVPEAVIASQRGVHTSATPAATVRSATSAPRVVERCPVIRVIEANAARKLAGDSSAASMASTADLHPLDQPILLIRNCGDFDAFTKSRTYVPVLRAIRAYLDQHEERTRTVPKPSFSNPAGSGTPARRPVCPVGLILDPSLTLGQRLAAADARSTVAQYMKLFSVHLIAALEFVREPDDAAHTRWPSSPAVLAAREASMGSTAASQLPPRLSVLYLDLRRSAVDDAAARWLTTSVILRAVRRARPFMLVSARGDAANASSASAVVGAAAAGGVRSTGGGAGGGAGGQSDAFMNFYSPDVKADMMWASLRHVLLTHNPRLSADGAASVLEELLATDATREVLLRQQGIDPKAQRAQAVAEALATGQVHPRGDAHLLPQLVLVDLDHNTQHQGTADTAASVHSAGPAPAKTASSSVPPDPLERSSAAVSTVPSSSAVAPRKAERVPSSAAVAAAAAAHSLPPSPQNNVPEPTARSGPTPPVPTPVAAAAAARATEASTEGQGKDVPTPQEELQAAAAQLPAQQPRRRRVPLQHTQRIKRAAQSPLVKAADATQSSAEVSTAPEQAPPTAPPPASSPPHPPPQQREIKTPRPDPLVSDPAPSHSPEPGTPPRSPTPRAVTKAAAAGNGASPDAPALPQLQRPATPPATPPRAATHVEAPALPSPQPREPEPTHTPSELPIAVASATSATPPQPRPPAPAVCKAQTPGKGRPLQQPQQQQQQQQQETHMDVAEAPATAKPKPARGGAAAAKDAAPVASAAEKKPLKRKPLLPAPTPAPPAAAAAPPAAPAPLPPVPVPPAPAPAAAAPPSVRRSSASSLHGFVKLPGEESVTAAHPPTSASGPPAAHHRKPAKTATGAAQEDAPPSPPRHPSQGRAAAPRTSPRPRRSTSARSPRAAATAAASARPQTTTTPPQLSRTSRKGLNGRVVPPQISSPPLPNRDASPRRRAKEAVITAAALDDAPDAIVKGHSARRPRETSPRPDVRCHSPTPPVSARWVAAAEERLPSPTRAAYFHSPVRPEALELGAVQALLAELRSPESEMMRASGQRRSSAPPPLVSPRGHHTAARRPSSVEAAIEAAPDVAPCVDAPSGDPEWMASHEEPWLDHAHPIERSSHVESVLVPPVGRRSGGTAYGYYPTPHDGSGGGGVHMPRSGRRRGLDIAALDPPEPQYAAAAAKISPAVWEAGVRKRHASPAQVAARRTSTPLGSARSRGQHHHHRGSCSSGAYDGVQARTNSPRQRDNVAAAKAAYEAATLAEARAKEAQARLAQRRSSAAFRALQQQHRYKMERGASLHVEGEVQSEHGGDAQDSAREALGGSPSPAPNRPHGARTPPSPQTPSGKDVAPSHTQQQQQQQRGRVGLSTAPRSVYARRRLSTAEAPHFDPGHTTTSKLRQLTSQRTRRVSEAEAEIKAFYANRATPRRDFRGAEAVASMALPQPTRDELTFVQQLQQQANERRHSLSARSGGGGDRRRASAAGAQPQQQRVFDADALDRHDVSNPAWRESQPRPTSSARGTPVKQQQQQRWAPAYPHRHSLRSPRGVPSAPVAADASDDDEESDAPSLSPWGTADYQGSAPRVDERDGVAPLEVNENGVALVHKALRTQRRVYY